MTNKKNPNELSWEELNAIVEGKSELGRRRTNRGLTLNASPLERSKYNLCKQILIYLHRIYSWKDYHLSEKYCTDRLGISPTQVEYVLFCHIEKFTLDELVGYAEKLLPPFELVAIHQRSGKISNVSAPDDELPELFPKK